MPAHWCGSILAGYLCRRGGSRIAGYHFAHQVDTEFTRGVKFDSEALGVAILGIMHTSEHTDAHRYMLVDIAKMAHQYLSGLVNNFASPLCFWR
jgi:hypothetical protein